MVSSDARQPGTREGKIDSSMAEGGKDQQRRGSVCAGDSRDGPVVSDPGLAVGGGQEGGSGEPRGYRL